jgi:hypothetical protein
MDFRNSLLPSGPVIDVQDSEGALPDKWDADTIAWEFSKPPIHGWALAWILRHGIFQDRKQLEEIHLLLARWTEWYFWPNSEPYLLRVLSHFDFRRERGPRPVPSSAAEHRAETEFA